MNFNFFGKSNFQEHISLDLNFDKKEFIQKFKHYIDDDRGLLVDELYRSKKRYLGEIDTDKFVLRKKRKFMDLHVQSSNAKGEIIDFNGKVSLKITISGVDGIAYLGLIIAPIFYLILCVLIIVNGVYPALIIFIPIAILFLAFPKIIIRNNMKKFKSDLIELLTHL
nr:hypothetical protein [uncultured Psychroserpens sp.]